MSAGTKSVPRRVRLDRARIIDTAIALVERQGPAALTMRRLGGELGVEAMAIYHHFASREHLLRAIAERLLEPLHQMEHRDGWRLACERFARTLRDVAIDRPATFGLVGLLPLDGPVALQPVERLLEALVGDGFSSSDALLTYRALASYSRGYALAETTGFTVDAAVGTARRRLQMLSTRDFPILAGHARELAALDADSAFERGLNALLGGFESLAAA